MIEIRIWAAINFGVCCIQVKWMILGVVEFDPGVGKEGVVPGAF
jgi:hypothetical protein